MASLTETTVEVVLRIQHQEDGSLLVGANARSFTASGEEVRRMSRDVTDQLSAARIAGINDLLADVVARVKTIWEIA